MLVGVLFLCLLTIAYSSPTIHSSRIIGGVETDPGEYPSQVSLLLAGFGHFGAGNVISEKWVLTAGHCIFGINVTDIEVLAGTNDLTNGGSRHHPLRFIAHENFVMNDVDIVLHDIGLIEVIEPFILGDFIRPVPLPTQDQPLATGTLATVIGWGYTDFSMETPNLMREVDIEVRDQDMCVAVYADVNKNVYPTELCADVPEGNLGSCKGDSGGPLLVDGTAVGLVSWAEGCVKPGFPTIYTRVASYRDWIRENCGV